MVQCKALCMWCPCHKEPWVVSDQGECKKMTGETPEVFSNKKKPIEEREERCPQDVIKIIMVHRIFLSENSKSGCLRTYILTLISHHYYKSFCRTNKTEKNRSNLAQLPEDLRECCERLKGANTWAHLTEDLKTGVQRVQNR